DRERSLADPCGDERPCLALPVPQADPTVAQVVRRPHRRARRLAGSRDGRAQPFLRQAGEDRTVGRAVLAGRERRAYGPEEVGWERDPSAAAPFLDGAPDTPADVGLVEISTTEPFLLEFADAHAGRVQNEDGECVLTRHKPEDRLDLVCG